ncbi:hypothetical protein ACLBWT_14420 [Paenibacillus sp. D51F]
MKKVLSILFSAALFLGVGSQAFAAEKVDVQQAMKLIEKTNKEIDEKINSSVKKADKLQADYLLEVRKIEEGDQVVKLKKDKEKVLTDLAAAQNDVKKQEELNKKLAKITAELENEQTKIDNEITDINQDIMDATFQLVTAEDKDSKKIEEKISKLNKKLNERSEKYQEKTQKFTSELEKIITEVYDETLKMSAETIKKAAELGVQAECSWKLVRFADKWVWIDPIRVVGC